ncbi:conserved hypothetical protein [Ricinus communis]|uniref:Uncharacterized protein n=1 Tax=Ricinus communis TaxID=3988 RepID=B9TN56_RICCO|nr:conserved hypothetical protein [Ricinus communis]
MRPRKTVRRLRHASTGAGVNGCVGVRSVVKCRKGPVRRNASMLSCARTMPTWLQNLSPTPCCVRVRRKRQSLWR